MQYLVSAEEMRRFDANTIEKIGIPGMVLMERAALASADFLKQYFKPSDGKVLVMAGMGNNGGDGLALARLLAEAGFTVDVWRVGDAAKASDQWVRQERILASYEVGTCDIHSLGEYTILVDALFGVGLRREVTGVHAEAVAAFNAKQGFKLALDVPSGVDSDTGKTLGCAVRADATMTFGFCKRGLLMYPGHRFAGEIYIADIGISERSFCGEPPKMFCLESVAELLPPRDPAGNKGTFGKVLLVAGTDKMAGAAILSAKAAYRSGAGMVKVITHPDNRMLLQEAVPEALFGTAEDLDDAMEWADVLAIGPGLGRAEKAGECLWNLVCKSEKPLIIDADGLNLLAADADLQQELAKRDGEVLLTPHVGELSRLSDVPADVVKECLWDHGIALAERLHAVVVAKDARTYVCAKDRPVCMNLFGNNGMATAGSGDVLTGILAGLLAQRMDPFGTACLGVTLHGAAGDIAAQGKGEHACMAGDIVEALSEAMKNGKDKEDHE